MPRRLARPQAERRFRAYQPVPHAARASEMSARSKARMRREPRGGTWALLVDVPIGSLVHPPEFVALVPRHLLVVGLDITRLVERDLWHDVGQPALGHDVLVLPVRKLH